MDSFEECFAIVQKVLEWLPRAPSNFDGRFVYSLKARLDRGQTLTDRQLMAMRTIVSKFKIGQSTIRYPAHRPTFVTPYYKLTDVTAHYY